MRPLPELTPENTAFWTGGAEGKLMIAFCADCQHAIHPPQLVCPEMLERSHREQECCRNRHRLHLHRQPPAMGARNAGPLRAWRSSISTARPASASRPKFVGAEPESVAIGQTMRITFTNIDDIWFPQWESAQ
jgi:hypothetical protein